MGSSLLGKEIRSILVFKQRNIGDVLLATPAFRALRAAFPKAVVAAVVNQGTEAMLTGNPDIDRILVFRRAHRDAGGPARWKEEIAFLREVRSVRPELAVQLTEGDRGAILSVLSGARFRVGLAPARRGMFGKERLYTHLCPPPDRYRHAALRDLDVLAAGGIPPADLSLCFRYAEDDRRNALRKLSAAGLPERAPYAVVQPTSRWTFKCWTDAGMSGVVAHLSRRGLFPVVTSGADPGEVVQASRVAAQSGVPCAVPVGALSLKELGASIAGARVFVGVDSAPMHLAAAVGTPVVSLFGPSGAYNWAPWEGLDWGYSAERRAGTRAVGRHVVVQKEWDCVPCGEDGCARTKRSRCLEEIPLDEVTDAVDRLLARTAER